LQIRQMLAEHAQIIQTCPIARRLATDAE
jgi:hypothetical protein